MMPRGQLATSRNASGSATKASITKLLPVSGSTGSKKQAMRSKGQSTLSRKRVAKHDDSSGEDSDNTDDSEDAQSEGSSDGGDSDKGSEAETEGDSDERQMVGGSQSSVYTTATSNDASSMVRTASTSARRSERTQSIDSENNDFMSVLRTSMQNAATAAYGHAMKSAERRRVECRVEAKQVLQIPHGSRSRRSSQAPSRSRRESIRLSHVPMRLTNSQFNLFTASTGGGMRKGDPYAKFLIGPRSVRIDVPTASEVDLLAAKSRTLTVGKAPRGGFSTRPQAIPVNKRKRKQLEKEKIKADIVHKWDQLEDLRIQIIARMRSLKHHYVELQTLKEQNKQLKEEYAEANVEMNSSISTIVASKDEQDRALLRAHRERKQRRAKLARELASSEQQALQRVQDVEKTLKARRAQLEEAMEDYRELVEFEGLSPDDLEKQVRIQEARKAALSEKHELALKKLREQNEADYKDMEHVFTERIMGIINHEKSNLSAIFNCAADTSGKTNAKLRREIAQHEEHQRRIREDIKHILAERESQLDKQHQLIDVRRKVLNLPKWMSCTPAMEFAVGLRDPAFDKGPVEQLTVVSTSAGMAVLGT